MKCIKNMTTLLCFMNFLTFSFFENICAIFNYLIASPTVLVGIILVNENRNKISLIYNKIFENLYSEFGIEYKHLSSFIVYRLSKQVIATLLPIASECEPGRGCECKWCDALEFLSID